MGKIHYFAYGSNMLTTHIQKRAPSSRFLATGRIPGRRLAFHKQSIDGSGKCDIPEGAADDVIWGVIYTVACSDLDNLDRCEGRGKGYERESIEILIGDEALQCETYLATNTEDGLRPYEWYKALVLAGILEHGLKDSYKQVYAVQAIADNNINRKLAQEARAALQAFCDAHPELADKLNGDWEHA
jgi:gamma-glutamylcyclotransferase